jgi:MSHA pilin protein MshC
MVELITVMVLVGVLAVVVIPRMDGAMSLRGSAWRDQVQAAALQARGLATSHRRLACLTLATGELRITLASANPATSCNTPVPGPDGDVRWAVDPQQRVLSASPGATLYFQPDGRVTQTGGAGTSTDFTVGLAGEADLTVVGSTGHVH